MSYGRRVSTGINILNNLNSLIEHPWQTVKATPCTYLKKKHPNIVQTISILSAPLPLTYFIHSFGVRWTSIGHQMSVIKAYDAHHVDGSMEIKYVILTCRIDVKITPCTKSVDNNLSLATTSTDILSDKITLTCRY